MTERLNTAPVLYDTPPRSLRQAVGIAVGAASVCWDSMEGAGVFLEGRANGIVDQLVELIEKSTDTVTRASYALGYAAGVESTETRSTHDVIRPEDDPDQLTLF